MRRTVALIFLFTIALAGQPNPSMQEYNRAYQLSGQGRTDEALNVLHELLTKDPSFHRAYYAVLQVFRQTGERDGPKRFVEELRSAFDRPVPHLLAGDILAYTSSGQPRKALAAMRQCISQVPEWPGCHIGYISNRKDAEMLLPALKSIVSSAPTNPSAWFSLGAIYKQLHRGSEAVEAYEHAVRQADGDLHFKIAALQELGGAATASRTDWARGRGYWEQALQLAIQLGDQEAQVGLLVRCLTISAFQLGEAEAARGYWERALAQTRESEAPFYEAWIYEYWGTLNREQGNANEAVEAYIRALKLYDGLDRPRDTADILRKLSDSEARRGDYQMALDHLGRAEQIARGLLDPYQEAFALNSRAEIEVQLGNYAQAIDLHLRARKMFLQLGSIQTAGGVAGDLGIAHERLGDDGKAEKWYRESLRSARLFRDTHEQERVLTHLAELSLRQGRIEFAVKALRESMALSTVTGNKRFRAHTLLLLGRTDARQGKYSKALKNLRAGVEIAESLKNIELEFIGAHGLGEVLLKDGRHAEAEREFRRALAFGEQGPLPDAVRAAHEGLGDVARVTGNLEEAVFHYGAAIEAIESVRARLPSAEFKTTFFSGTVGAYERMIESLAQLDRGREALYFAEKGRARALLDMVTTIHGALGPDVVGGKALEAGAIEHDMTRRDRVLVEYALGDERSYVWTVNGKHTVMTLLPRRLLIEQKVEQYRALLTARSPKVSQEASALYQILISPAASQLIPDKELIVVPDGALHYLPFDTLRSEKGRYLGEDFTITYSPSASVMGQLPERRPAASRMELLAFGDPDFGVGSEAGTEGAAARSVDFRHGMLLAPLPNSRFEIQAIAALYPSSNKVYLGVQASKRSVGQERLHDYIRIHFAAHAFIDEITPERSGIALSPTDGSDGVLRLKDILALKLNADLVVLSACQTGLGKIIRGEGIAGMTRAFLLAGTSRVVASLWDVNDVATADLMKAFYGHMKAGIRPAPALRAAKLDMIHSGVTAYRDPYYWAAFVLVGAP